MPRSWQTEPHSADGATETDAKTASRVRIQASGISADPYARAPRSDVSRKVPAACRKHECYRLDFGLLASWVQTPSNRARIHRRASAHLLRNYWNGGYYDRYRRYYLPRRVR